jgi:hypothetical protein
MCGSTLFRNSAACIAESVSPTPGLAHSALPGFADVDLFDSQQVIANRISKGEWPEGDGAERRSAAPGPAAEKPGLRSNNSVGTVCTSLGWNTGPGRAA